MFERIARKHRVYVIALLPLFLFAFPHFAAAQSDAQKLFDTNCAKCQIHTQIEQGKGNMPPFGGTLNKAQIDSLIPIVRSFGKKSAGAKKPS
jgi:mono/diheme cytochrome c family protein